MAVRDDARRWYEAHWDPDRPVGDWWELMGRSGWGYPGWPVDHLGKGLGRVDARVVREERRAVGALPPPSGIGPTLMAPILFEHGTDAQLDRILPELAWGGRTMCQMLSEPDAGSDLAAVTTRAERDGDEWVVSGVKIWTSLAHEVDYGMLLARTDPSAPKHQGLTFFMVERDQPGIEVRPLRTMVGTATFNQVFFDGARVADDMVVGDPGEGWAVTRTFLAHEKNSYNPDSHEGGPFGKVDLSQPCGALLAAEAGKRSAAAQGRGAGRLLADLVDRFDRGADPLVRQRLVRIQEGRRTMAYTNQRVRATRRQGRSLPGFEGPVSKLQVSELGRRQRDLGLEVQGAHGTLVGDDAPDARFQHFALSTPSLSIAGGTDEIQRNHIAERVLGLPREPAPGDGGTAPG